MKILFITQKIDTEDGILGVYHEWAKELAKRAEFINVLALGVGKYDLPENVEVYSLGKESGQSRLKYLFRFYKFVWALRKQYDLVFVHMNPEYIILGAWLWKIWQKKIFLWYNHKMGGLKVRVALKFVRMVFYTSKDAFVADFKKSKTMPVGVDTTRFKIQDSGFRIQDSILSLGRISPVKNLDILIEALKILEKKGVNFICDICGDPTEKDAGYYEKIKKQAEELAQRGLVRFYKGMPNYEVPNIYNRHEIFVNLTQSGSFDKTIIEAMACGCLPVISNRSVDILPEEFLFQEKRTDELAERIEGILNLSAEEKSGRSIEFRHYAEKHDIKTLADELAVIFKQ